MDAGSDVNSKQMLDRFEALVVRLEKISAAGGGVKAAAVAGKVVAEVKKTEAPAGDVDFDELFKKVCFKNVAALLNCTAATKQNPDLLRQAVNIYLDLLNC